MLSPLPSLTAASGLPLPEAANPLREPGTSSGPDFAALMQHQADRQAALRALDQPPAAPATQVPAAVLERGRALALQGDPTRQIPACTQCHGRAMTGVLPAFPGLLGLPRDYLVGQLGAWQTDKRRAAAPDCMAQIAKRLSDEEVSAIATWLSSQTLPAQTHAVAASTAPLPVECGSGPR